MLLLGCRPEAFSHVKGKVNFNEAGQSFTLRPTGGNYGGFYFCAPTSDVNRDPKAS